MGFFIRKSIRVGPLKFNLSKSGIGVSTGIKGLRVGFGPRGNYIHAGSNGVYYRSTLTPKQVKNQTPLNPASEPVGPGAEESIEMKEIDSDMQMLFQNSSEDQLVQEISKKLKMWSTWKAVALLAIVGTLYTQPWFFGLGLLLTVGAYLMDETRRSVVLFYDFDEKKQSEFQSIVEEYTKILAVRKVWHLHSQGTTSDWKKNGGASTLVKRNVTATSLKPPKFLKSNIPVPTIKVGSQTLCFLPEKALLLSSAGAASIKYEELVIEIESTRFIETESVPGDAEVIDYTWQYVNKSGGPDKRFKSNGKIPVCRYEVIQLRSSTGLNEQLILSKCDQLRGFKSVVCSVRTAS